MPKAKKRKVASGDDASVPTSSTCNVIQLSDQQLDQVAEKVAKKMHVPQQIQHGAEQIDDTMSGEPSLEDNLGVHLSNGTKTKIINGEFVELHTLLPSNKDSDDKQVVVIDGNILVKEKVTKSSLDIHAWTDAFLIYASVYSSVHCNESQGLLKYMYNVRLAASRVMGKGWLSYDEQFRHKKARNPSLPWFKVDQELWLLYVYNSRSSSQVKSSPNQIKKCYDFNFKGFCNKAPCNYFHLCILCGKSHPSKSCKLKFNRPNVSSSRSSPNQGARASGSNSFVPWPGKVAN